MKVNMCDDCDEIVDAGETLCERCAECRLLAWHEHQDRIREQRDDTDDNTDYQADDE